MHSTKQQKGINLTIAVLIAIMSILCGIYFSKVWQEKKHREFINHFNGSVFGVSREVLPFSFEGTNGLAFSDKSLKGRWSLVFFGFTNCPMLCPTTMTTLGKFYKHLEAAKVKDLPQVVMVSLDPARDSLTRLKDYVQGFDAHFLGARSDEKSINALTSSFGVVHMKDDKGGKNYNIEHSGAVLIFNPQGEWAGFFQTPHDEQKMTEDFIQLVG